MEDARHLLTGGGATVALSNVVLLALMVQRVESHRLARAHGGIPSMALGTQTTPSAIIIVSVML